MKHQPQSIYKVNCNLAPNAGVFTVMHKMLQGLDWLHEHSREDTFVNVYKGERRVTFVLNDLETALLMRLSLE